ncbi:MAG: RNA 2',3'-cyclic phosphodiesterase [Planctomycetaceae bacterium]
MTKCDTSRTTRLFGAVTVRSTPSIEQILSRLSKLGRAVQAIRNDQLHITLKFYGHVADTVIPSLVAGLDDVARDTEPFTWTVRGTRAFPSTQRPNVIWAGADDGGRFAELAEQIERFGVPLGFARERRAFAPHLTLARIKFRPPQTLAELLQETSDYEFGSQRADSLVLMQSETGPGGSTYTPLHTATFDASRSTL